MSFLASGYVAVMMPIGDISFFYSNIRSGVLLLRINCIFGFQITLVCVYILMLYLLCISTNDSSAPVSVKDCKFQASDMALIL